MMSSSSNYTCDLWI